MFSSELTIDEPKEFEDDEGESGENMENSNLENDNESFENMEQCHSNNSAMSNSSSRRKRCLPQRQITTDINNVTEENGILHKDCKFFCSCFHENLFEYSREKKEEFPVVCPNLKK